MKFELLSRLRCPQSGQPLFLESDTATPTTGGEISTGWLVSKDAHRRYPIRGGIPRFVTDSNYADNFGMQWNHFAKTQLDSHSGHPISAERFWNATGWNQVEMKDQWVLDVGCGSGRFAEVALSAGAQVVALDYSSAVDACYDNLRHYPNLHVVQGDIYALPFIPESFSFVYSLGVLQHTPDVDSAFAALPPMLSEGGRLCADFYWNRLRTLLHPKYLLRPFTKRMDPQRLFELLGKYVPNLLRFSQFLGSVPVGGRFLKRIVPVVDYSGIYPLSQQQLVEWALLDTFDMLAPAFDNPQSLKTVKKWFLEAGFANAVVQHGSNGIVGRSKKPDMRKNTRRKKRSQDILAATDRSG